MSSDFKTHCASFLIKYTIKQFFINTYPDLRRVLVPPLPAVPNTMRHESSSSSQMRGDTISIVLPVIPPVRHVTMTLTLASSWMTSVLLHRISVNQISSDCMIICSVATCPWVLKYILSRSSALAILQHQYPATNRCMITTNWYDYFMMLYYSTLWRWHLHLLCLVTWYCCATHADIWKDIGKIHLSMYRVQYVK